MWFFPSTAESEEGYPYPFIRGMPDPAPSSTKAQRDAKNHYTNADRPYRQEERA
jgi:hypothetical protein